MPKNCKFETANILGVLDPPRAGVNDKVIIGCRKVCFFNAIKNIFF